MTTFGWVRVMDLHHKFHEMSIVQARLGEVACRGQWENALSAGRADAYREAAMAFLDLASEIASAEHADLVQRLGNTAGVIGD